MGGVSTVVAGDDKMLKVHTHTAWPGKILDYGVSLGSLLDINIENLQEQSLNYAAESEAEHAAAFSAPAPAINEAPAAQIATVAVVAGAGFEQVFKGLGVSAVISGGQTMNPSIEELLEAVNAVPTQQVILLPNNSNVILSARQVNALTEKEVYIVPTETMPQGIAALVSFNFEADFPTNCETMTEAAQNIQTAEITTAVGQRMQQVIADTLQRMQIDRYEVVTLYYGEDVTAQQAEETAGRIKEQHSHLEIEVVNGGQPHYAYIISAE